MRVIFWCLLPSASQLYRNKMNNTHRCRGTALMLIYMTITLASAHSVRTRSTITGLGFLSAPYPLYIPTRPLNVHSDAYNSVSVGEGENQHADVPGYLMDDVPRASDAMTPSVNTVTLCGHIGYVDQPITIGTDFRAIRIALATNERGRSGTVKTQWHKIVVYGQGNVDYVHSRARVGDRALVIGSLSYYTPPNQDGTPYKAKIAEVSVRYRGAGHSFILMPRSKYQDEEYPMNDTGDDTYNFNHA